MRGSIPQRLDLSATQTQLPSVALLKKLQYIVNFLSLPSSSGSFININLIRFLTKQFVPALNLKVFFYPRNAGKQGSWNDLLRFIVSNSDHRGLVIIESN